MIAHDVRPTVAERAPVARHRRGGDGWTGLALGAALVAITLVAGLSFTFAVAVMPNLADADDVTFVATMQRFNDNPAFVLSFALALVLTALAAVLHRRHGPATAVRWTIAALVLYGVVLAVTLGINVPLNDDVDRVGTPDRAADLADVRDRFESRWVAANAVRTVLSIAALGTLTRSLLLHGRATATRHQWAPPSGSPRLDEPSPAANEVVG